MLNKVLKTLGIIFIMLAGGLIVTGGYEYHEVRVLNSEGTAYANVAIPAITTAWDKRQLVDRASPALMKAVTPGQLDILFGQLARLGTLISFDVPTGRIQMFHGTGTSFEGGIYITQAKFRNGTAALSLHLAKSNGRWLIDGFQVDPKAVSGAGRA